ncbi:MAG: tetratricopeptide repeat-containing sensor histidine kinase [Sphingobacteriales bacterium]|nr:tetratricopeptide repeat-containing sensor histidine kinase [Sphingobacteriales bacterium]
MVIDTISINKIDNEFYQVYQNNPSKAYKLSQKLLQVSKKVNYQKGIALAKSEQALLALDSNQFEKAIKLYQEAYPIFVKLNEQKNAANTLFNLAYANSYLGEYKKSINNYTKALKIYQIQKDSDLLSSTYTNLAIIYDEAGEYEKAIDFYFKTYQIDKKRGKKNLLGTDLNNIGQLFETLEIHDKAADYLNKSIAASLSVKDSAALCYAYESLSMVELNQNHTDKASDLLRLSLAMSKTFPDDDIISLLYADFCKIYLAKNEMDSARMHLNKSLEILQQKNIPYNISYALVCEAQLHNYTKNPTKAIQAAIKGIQLTDKIGSLPLKINLLVELKKAYAQQQNYKAAYEAQEQANTLRKQLNTGEIIKKITALLLTQEYEQKESLEKERRAKADLIIKNRIERKNSLITIFIIICVFTILISVILYLNHKKQKKVNRLLWIKNKEISKNRNEISYQAEQLAELNEVKDRLFTIISHDLRKPIHQLTSVIDLLETNLLDKEDMENMMPSISKSVKDTSELLDSLLFWAKTQMKGFKLKLKEVNLNSFIQQNLSVLESQIQEKKIVIINHIPEDFQIQIDELLMKIIIRNLLSNAIKFSYSEGEISINLAKQNGFIALSIKDNGAGMSKEQLDNLFTPKVKSTKGTKNEVGSGLGLIFCKDLIEKSGGKIWVKSELNKGSEFFFSIPKY